MRLFIFLALLASSLAVVAAPDEAVVTEMSKRTGLTLEEIRSNYNACDSGITLPMKICGSYRWIAEDMRLNAIYTQALAKAKEMGYQASLVKAQRAWIAYRDAACSFEGQMGAGGGSAEGLYVISCKKDLTKIQADRLENAIRTE